MKNSCAIFSFFLCLAGLARADVTLPDLFSDHAVLQKAAQVPVWGQADPAEKITVTLGGEKVETQAGTDGKWRVSLNLKDKGPGPFELLVEGKNKLRVADVVVGEVWVCSGQSNMEFLLSATLGAPEEMALPPNPQLRQFRVANAISPTPLEGCKGKWVIAAPDTVGSFTAVGYFFGKALQQELKMPVGLLHTSWGGTPSEAWTSVEAFDSHPDLKAGKDKNLEKITLFPQQMEEYRSHYQTWLTEFKRQDQGPANAPNFSSPTAETGDWKTITLPAASFSKQGLPDAGALWLRKTVTLDQTNVGQDLPLRLDGARDLNAVYWNGEKIEPVRATPLSLPNGRYLIPKNLVQAGENTLVLRIFCPSRDAGFSAKNSPFTLGKTTLDGEWKAKAEFELPPLEAKALSSLPKLPPEAIRSQNSPSHLFNAMIRPLIPYAIKGVIWYQGESNAGRAFQYRSAFPLMIQDWRSHWKQGDFPFYFCQLANYNPKKDAPAESSWAELREAQTLTLSQPNTGMAVLIDIGETNDIHPRNKKDAGERLSRIALAKDYGKTIPFTGPTFKSLQITGDQAVLQFDHTDGGLTARPLPETQVMKSSASQTAPLVLPMPGSPLQGFALCGEDKVWKWAKAKIEGDTVVVSSPEIPKPVAVRYAWSDNPTCNLYNGAGLPAVPFRTDDFTELTREARY